MRGCFISHAHFHAHFPLTLWSDLRQYAVNSISHLMSITPRFKDSCISGIVGIDVQPVRSWCLNPFGGNGNIFEYESLDTARNGESEILYVYSFDNRPVKVPYKRGHQQIDRILRHERLRQPSPSESVVHVIEDSFLSATEVVELDNILCIRFKIICQNTPVSIFAFLYLLSIVGPFCLWTTSLQGLPFHFSTAIEFSSYSILLISSVLHPLRMNISS